MASDLRNRTAASAPAPSSKLLNAALAGILALSVNGCASDSNPTTKTTDTTDTDAAAPAITSSQHVDSLDADGFKALCDARSGTVEIMPHCGGFSTGPGFSYDVSNSELSEHTCKGANTCGGWNCLTDEPQS